MSRQPKYIRIVEDNGNVRRVEQGAREVSGLHYRRTTPKGKRRQAQEAGDPYGAAWDGR